MIEKVKLFAEINNGFETKEVVKTLPVYVMPSSFCSIIIDDSDNSLLGIKRNSVGSQTVVIVNLGNLPLSVDITHNLEPDNWGVEISDSEVTELLPGNSQEIQINLETNDDTGAGIVEFELVCGDSKEVIEVSVQNTKTQGLSLIHI